MILLALAAQLSAPIPIKPDAWFTEGDIAAFLNLRAQGVTGIDYGLNVAPDGKVQDCFIERSSGHVAMDRQVCGKILQNARLRPATDTAGRPAYGVYHGSVEWFNGDGEPPKAQPVRLLDLTVASLPPKTASPAEVRVMFAVDTKGMPTSCEPQRGQKAGALARVACGQILQNYTAIPARNTSGAPVSSVQSAVVRFFKS